MPGLNDFFPYQGPDVTTFDIVRPDPRGVDDLIDSSRGVTVDFWKGWPCPCARAESGRTRGTCPLCGGKRFVYPVAERIETKVLLPEEPEKMEGKSWGPTQSGSIRVTFRSDVHPERGDLILPRGRIHRVVEVIAVPRVTTSEGAVRDLRGNDVVDPPAADPGALLLRYPRVTEVIGIHWRDEAAARRVLHQFGAAAVTDLLPGQLEQFYAAGFPEVRDYDVLNNRIVLGENLPPGTSLTVKYSAPAVYCVSEDPAYRADGDLQLQFKPVTAVRYDAMGQDDGGRVA